MPNWCENRLIIKHDNPEELQRFVDAWNTGELLQTLIPCPAELRDTMAGYMGDSKDVSRQYAKEGERTGQRIFLSVDFQTWELFKHGLSEEKKSA